jgi:hypothetical protein
MTYGPKDQVDRDVQDHQFGMAAAEDQELADELENEGASDDELPDPPANPPRAADKAVPADD